MKQFGVMVDKWVEFDVSTVTTAWNFAKKAGLVTWDCDLETFTKHDSFDAIMRFYLLTVEKHTGSFIFA